MAPKRDQHTYNVGDMVWTKVGGYPYWPGQVMDPETAPEKAKRTYRKGKVLVSFFGDNTHGCYPPMQLSSYEKHVEKYKHGVGATAKTTSWKRDFEIAVEQAEELVARRQGLTPATAHLPLDFRLEAPSYDVEFAAEAGLELSITDLCKPVRPGEAEGFDVCAAHKLLLLAARNIDVMPSSRSDLGVAPALRAVIEAEAGEGEPGEGAAAQQNQPRHVPEVEYDQLNFLSRYLFWRNFHNLPIDIKKKLSRAEAGWTPEGEARAAAIKAEQLVKQEQEVKEEKNLSLLTSARRKHRKASAKKTSGKRAKIKENGEDDETENGFDAADVKSEGHDGSDIEMGDAGDAPAAAEDENDHGNASEGGYEDALKEVAKVGKGVKGGSRGKGSTRGKGGKGRKGSSTGPLGAELLGVKGGQTRKSKGKGRGGAGKGRGAGKKSGARREPSEVELSPDDDVHDGDNDQEGALGSLAIGGVLGDPHLRTPWPPEVAVHAVESEAAVAGMCKPLPEEMGDVEETAVQCGVPLMHSKVNIKKLLVRLKQYARAHEAAHDILLNPHNVAGMHKLSHLLRALQTQNQNADTAQGTAQCTRDEQVGALRLNMQHDVRTWQLQQEEWQAAVEQGTVGAEAPPDQPPPGPPSEPDTSLMKSDPPELLCISHKVYVPMHAYRHLTLIQGNEGVLLCTLRAFWRSRAMVLQKLSLDEYGMEVDVPELLKLVSRRGGFWCTCAIQGDGESTHAYESLHGWQFLVRSCWLAHDRPGLCLAKAAAQLQSYYYTWLLPFEQWVLREYHACTATVCVPAHLVRRLAYDRGHDSVLSHTVKFFASVAQAGTEDHPNCLAGRHDLALQDGLELVTAAISPLLGGAAVDDFVQSFSLSSSNADPLNVCQLHAILPPTVPGQPDLAHTLLHPVTVSTGAAAADSTGPWAAACPMHEDQNDLQNDQHAKRGRSSTARAEGCLISDSADEQAASDDERGRHHAREDLDSRVREHIRGPRWARQRSRASGAPRGGPQKRKRGADSSDVSDEQGRGDVSDNDDEEEAEYTTVKRKGSKKKQVRGASALAARTTARKCRASKKAEDSGSEHGNDENDEDEFNDTHTTAHQHSCGGEQEDGKPRSATPASLSQQQQRRQRPRSRKEKERGADAPAAVSGDAGDDADGAGAGAGEFGSHRDGGADGAAHEENGGLGAERQGGRGGAVDAPESAPVEPKPVNKFKRQLSGARHGGKAKEDGRGGAWHGKEKPWCTQFDFDARYPRISDTRLREAVEKGKFKLVSHELSRVAGRNNKSMVLYFASRPEAERAAKELPTIIRRQEQRQAYDIATSVLKYNDAQHLIKSAKEQREQHREHPPPALRDHPPTSQQPPSLHQSPQVAEVPSALQQAPPAMAMAAHTQQPQVVILQAPGAGYPAQGYMAANAGMVVGAAGGMPQVADGTTHAPAAIYPQGPPYAAGAVFAHTVAPQYAAAAAAPGAALPAAPPDGTLAPAAVAEVGMGVSTSLPFNSADLSALLSAATGAPNHDVHDPPEEKSNEEGFLSVLESLRGGVPNFGA